MNIAFTIMCVPSEIPRKNEVLPTTFHLLDYLHKCMKNIPKNLHVQYGLPDDFHDVRNMQKTEALI
jgi:hypothetical protein